MAKTDWTAQDDAALEAFFSAARDEAPVPSADLLGRIMADAETEASAREVVTTPRRTRIGIWATLGAAIGGWPALASMATATAAGVWIGVAEPQPLTTVTAGLFPSSAETQYELEEFLPGYSAMAVISEEVAQ